MREHLQYLSYVVRHKWYVLDACLHHGLYWRGIKHDWHKLLPSEWFPYVRHFFGRDRAGIKKGRDDGHYKPTETGDPAFEHAWLLHQKRADHHWQWWCLAQDDGGMKVLEMSPDAQVEMVCDWIGASRAQGYGGFAGVQKWYAKNRGRMQLGPETRRRVECFLLYQQSATHREPYQDR